MKKLSIIILSAVMTLSVCACSGGPNPSETTAMITDAKDAEKEASATGASEATALEESKSETPESNIVYTYEGEPVDLLTIEEITIDPFVVKNVDDAQFYGWKMKVRNTSGSDLQAKESSMRIFYNYLDENMDVLESSHMSGGYSTTIKEGRAELMEQHSYPANWSKKELEAVRYLEFFGYTITLHGTADFEFTNPILIDLKELKYVEPEKAEISDNYKDVQEKLFNNVWYFNGGSDTDLNRISFTDIEAKVEQVSFDENGKHENSSLKGSYSIDDETITVQLGSSNEITIPYSINEEGLILDSFFTPEQVDASLQGYWRHRYNEKGLVGEDNIYFDKGVVKSERASVALGATNGEYYYYGPYESTYTLNFGGLDTEMRHGNCWFFNIIDGDVVVLRYEEKFSKIDADSLPGEDGYSFN